MNRKVILAAVLAGFVSAPASAQVMIEMSQITCKEMVGYDQPTREFISMWMSGYFSAKNNWNVLQLRYLDRNKKYVEKYCKKHKNAAIMDVIQKVGK